MEIAFLVIYSVILGLVAPYVIGKSLQYGELVPSSSALVGGSILWAIFTWIGLSYEQVWIWVIVMLAMPACLFAATFWLTKKRNALDTSELDRIRHSATTGASKKVEYLS